MRKHFLQTARDIFLQAGCIINENRKVLREERIQDFCK